MKQIVTVSPLSPAEVAQMAEAEKNLGISRVVHESRQREYFAVLEALKKRYDKDYEKNSKQQINKYSAQVVNNCVVISLE
jgi:hypothetical protein